MPSAGTTLAATALAFAGVGSAQEAPSFVPPEVTVDKLHPSFGLPVLLMAIRASPDVLSFCQHIMVIFHFHLSEGYSLEVKPFMDDHPHGVFATRAPRRPNPIGLSVVKLVKVEGHTLQVEDLDIVDGTPLLDIKPYVPEFDAQKAERTGWLSKRADKVHEVRSDERFK